MFVGKFAHNKANSHGQISATLVCAMNSTSLTLLQFAGDLRRYCDTKSHVLLLNTNRTWKIQSWCGVTCSRTEGALLATAGFQALGKNTPMSGTSVCALGNDRYGQRK